MPEIAAIMKIMEAQTTALLAIVDAIQTLTLALSFGFSGIIFVIVTKR